MLAKVAEFRCNSESRPAPDQETSVNLGLVSSQGRTEVFHSSSYELPATDKCTIK